MKDKSLIIIINITTITYEADTNRTGTYLLYMYNR